MSNILIEANNISKIYDRDIFFKRGTNFRALNMVDFVLKEHDFIAIMGPRVVLENQHYYIVCLR